MVLIARHLTLTKRSGTTVMMLEGACPRAASLCPPLEQTCPASRTNPSTNVSPKMTSTAKSRSAVNGFLPLFCNKINTALAVSGENCYWDKGLGQGTKSLKVKLETACSSPGAQSYAESNNEVETIALPDRINFLLSWNICQRKVGFPGLKTVSLISVLLNRFILTKTETITYKGASSPEDTNKNSQSTTRKCSHYFMSKIGI